jgi:phage gp37-like protein
MSTLSLRTALTQIERAVQFTIILGLQKRPAAVASIAALRAVASRSPGGSVQLLQFDLQPVTEPLSVWLWYPYSTAADNDSTVVQPSDVPVGEPGRWLIADNPQKFAPHPDVDPVPERLDEIQSGYLNRVILWNGEFKRKEFEERILAYRPCVAIAWNASQNNQAGTYAGNITEYPASFEILICSQNLRPEQESIYGGGTAADTAEDPGAIRILGDVKQLLADAGKYDPILAQAGIQRVVLGDEDMVDVDLAERKAVLSLMVKVEATIINIDPPSEVIDLDGIDTQPELTQLNDADEFDPDNYVVTYGSFAITPGFGLSATPAEGSAYVDGTLVDAYAAPLHTFDANSDTYRDLVIDPDDGPEFVYVTVQAGCDEPDVTADALRVAVTTTSATSITADRYLAAVSTTFGEPFASPKP